MKKLLAALVSVLLAVLLSACCCIPFDKLNNTSSIVSDYEYNSSMYEEESEVTYSSEESSSQASQPSSEPQSQPQTSQPAPVAKDPKSYTMFDYYGMTINDVVDIWGQDYALGKDLIAGGWAYIYYKENCPFVFCYQSSSIPTSCSGNERLSGIIAYPYPDENEFLVIEGLSIVSSYATVSSKFQGRYWVNEMDGVFSYSFVITELVSAGFDWVNEGDTVPSEVHVEFFYNN